jgi:hypothetical protein
MIEGTTDLSNGPCLWRGKCTQPAELMRFGHFCSEAHRDDPEQGVSKLPPEGPERDALRTKKISELFDHRVDE